MLIENPIIRADFPDPDVIRVNNTYYMVTTTMFMMPGGQILKSKDLYHWEIVSFIFNSIEDNDIYQLKNGKNAYGKGQWATSLKYYRGKFYACFVCHDMRKTYIYYTNDIEKSGWDRYELNEAYHDMSLFFDGDIPYLIYGNGDIGIVELNEDLSGIKERGVNLILFKTPSENMLLRCEGCRAYKLNGYYYLIFIDWPNDGFARRRVICYRSGELLGKYEQKVLLDDDMEYHNMGVAQGALIDTPEGDWYAVLFQDHGAVGRIPYLVPVTWKNNWPEIGVGGKVPKAFEVPFEEYAAEPLIFSDSFSHLDNVLDLRWQWNHNPIDECWSFTERPGYFRLRTKYPATDILTSRNILTQRTSGPRCSFTVQMETNGMKSGDYAGLVAFQGNYGTIGIKIDANGKKRILTCKKESGQQKEDESVQLTDNRIYLKITFDYEDGKDLASFLFSKDGIRWNKLGCDLQMRYTLDLFIGYRIGLFNYSVKETGGFADFCNFTYGAIIP